MADTENLKRLVAQFRDHARTRREGARAFRALGADAMSACAEARAEVYEACASELERELSLPT